MRRWLWVLAMAALAGCADVAMTPAPLTPLPPATWVLGAAVTGAPQAGSGGGTGSGAARTLPAGSRWITEGRIGQGTVLRPQGRILTAEANNVHEAAIVVENGRWVGFWLRVEHAFTPLADPAPIDLAPN